MHRGCNNKLQQLPESWMRLQADAYRLRGHKCDRHVWQTCRMFRQEIFVPRNLLRLRHPALWDL